ncbi:MAG: hypothetical protein AAGJ55_06480 [Cyanobacteria bacterium J06555_12]
MNLIPNGDMTGTADDPYHLDYVRSLTLEQLLQHCERDCSDIELYIELGIRYVRLRRYNLAKEYYERAFQLDKCNPWLHLYVGNLYYAWKKYRVALKFFNIALQLIPNNPCPYWCIADCFAAIGEGSRAEMFYKKATQVDPNCPDASCKLKKWYERQYEHIQNASETDNSD